VIEVEHNRGYKDEGGLRWEEGYYASQYVMLVAKLVVGVLLVVETDERRR